LGWWRTSSRPALASDHERGRSPLESTWRAIEYSAGAALAFLPFMLLSMQKWLPCGRSC